MSTRRDFMKQLSATAGIGALSALGLGISAPRALALAGSWYMPDENAVQERIYLAFAAKTSIWDTWATPVNNNIALLAKTIAKYQPVTVMCRSADLSKAKAACGTSTNIKYLTMPLDDVWCRDYGGCFVVDDNGGRGLVDFNFNGWGNKQAHANDAYAADELSYSTNATYIQSQLTGEGGGIEVDGHGTAIMTESCWINNNRNPGMTKAQIEAELKANLGLRKIIWLPGIKGKDITDAHVDFYARFASKGVVVANLDNDPNSYDYQVTRTHLPILQNATDADGVKLTVHTMSPPRNPRKNQYTTNNPDFAAGYINYLPINGAVIAPQFGDATADAACKALLTKLYPGRAIVQVNIDAVAGGGGGIHCVTKNMPQA